MMHHVVRRLGSEGGFRCYSKRVRSGEQRAVVTAQHQGGTGQEAAQGPEPIMKGITFASEDCWIPGSILPRAEALQLAQPRRT